MTFKIYKDLKNSFNKLQFIFKQYVETKNIIKL